MPRTSKAAEKKQQQGMEFLLGLVKQTGQEVEEEEIKKAFEPPIKSHDYRILQAEGVLLHLQVANRTMEHKFCARCKEVFSTRYRSVAYCSDLCRQKAMEEIGIVWNPRNDSYQNMDAERPIVIGAEAHQVVLKAAQRFLEDQNILVKEESKPPVESQEQQTPEFPTLPDFLQTEVLKQAGLTSETNQFDLPTSPEILPLRSSDLSLDFLESPFQL